MSGRLWALMALFSAGTMLVLAGKVLAGEALTMTTQVVVLLGLGGMFAAEAIRGLRGTS